MEIFQNLLKMETTRESAKQESHNQLVNNLQELLEKNYDAEKGYKKALGETKDANLRQFLKKRVVERNHFATELDKIIRSLNEHPKEKGSAIGDLHRTWMNIKTLLSANKNEALLEECIRGEKASKKEYEEKLKKYKFPPTISEILKRQLSEISATVEKIKKLEDLEEE